MAKSSGLAQKFFVGSSDLSGDIASIDTWSTEVGSLEVTGIDSSGVERLQGLVTGNVSFTSFFNDATGAAHLTLRVPSTGTPVTWALGQSVGSACAMLQAEGLDYQLSRGQDGAITFSVPMDTYTTLPVWGVMLTAGLDRDTTGASTATLDQGAQTSAGAEAILHVTSFTGSNFTATVQDSANGSDWGTHKAFTQVTDVGTERVTVSGTVERYVRVTTTGTFNPVDYAVSFRRGAATDRVTYA